MTKDTNTTSGAAGRPEALRRSTAADGKTELFNFPGYPLMVRAVDFNRIHAESEMRRAALLDEMQKTALAAGQATAAQAAVQDDLITLRKPTTSAEMLLLLKLAHFVISDVDKTLEESVAPAQPVAEQGVAYAALPDLSDANGEIWSAIIYWKHAKRGEDALRKASELERVLSDQMHAFADATCALRASHGQAPASKIEGLTAAQESLGVEFERVLHDNLFDLYEESPHTARLESARAESVPAVSDLPPLPAPDLRDVGTKPQEIKEFLKGYATEYARTAIAARAPADSVQEDAARLDWLEQNLFHREKDEWDTKFGGYKEYNMWVLFSPKGIQGRARDIIDAARNQGASQ